MMTSSNISEIVRLTAKLNELLDENQAAALLTVTPGTLSVWRSTGRYNLPFVKVGRNVRYRRCDLVAWLEARVRQSGSTV